MSPTSYTNVSAVAPASEKKAPRPATILHRTPWHPPVAVSGQGIYITLEDGREVIDAAGGAAVTCLGNGHPVVLAALKEQVDKLAFVFNEQFLNEPAVELSRILVESGKGAFELCSFLAGGSEAMEGVLKLARQYWYEQDQPQRKNFISRDLSYHGNTINALSLSGHPARRAPYNEILQHEIYHKVSPAYAKRFQKVDETEEQYVERLRQELEDKIVELGPDTVIGCRYLLLTVVAETVVGATTGVVPAPKGYFRAIKSVCRKYGVLFILDEIMCGMGRMGTTHAWESFGDNEPPDIQAVAKGLGGGYSCIGAILVSKQVADVITKNGGHWKHGHSFMAHPMSCAGAVAVQKVIAGENLLANGRQTGEYLGQLLRERLLSPNSLARPFTFDVRGGGSFWAVEFDFSGTEERRETKEFAMDVQARCLENGVIVMGMPAGANVEEREGGHIIFAPAYNITVKEVERVVEVFVLSVEWIVRRLGSSTRVKAPKQKVAKDNNIPDQTTSAPAEPSSSRQTRSNHQSNPSKRTRDAKGKGKSQELTEDQSASRTSKKGRRTTYPVTTSALTINEPTRDTKGKKRAAAEAPSEDLSASAPPGPSKRPRPATTAYALRSRSDAIQSPEMPKKMRQSSTTKGKAAAAKSKAMAAPGPSRVEDDDVEMMDVEYKHEASDHDDQMDLAHDDRDEGGDEDGDENAGSGPAGDGAGEEDGGGMINGVGGLPRGFAGLDESAAMAIFADYRQLGTYMSGLSSRLKTMLNNIKASADPTTRVVTLQELSELLSISTEDTLAGSFQVDAFVRELVKILGGTGNAADDDDGDDDDESHEQDEDAQLAAALALSGGGQYQGDDNLEAQVLAARCLANLMEALPGVAHTVVYHGAIPVLCSKLIEISYIDLAEQTLSTLEKISEEFPSSIVRENGLAALLNYLDFFSIAVQRTALQAASNCCRNVPPEHFQMIRSVWPIIRNCLGYSDQRLVEFACLCVIRVIDSYYRSSPENLEILVDAELITAVNVLLLPAGGSPLIAANTFTQLLRALATSARASPNITIVLLEAGIVDTLYQILTGVLPSSQSESEEQGDAPSGQGLGGGLADMTVMQNLAHRPKDQVEEALSLIAELLPPLPKDGVYDHKAYTEKSLARMIKAKAKADRAAARQAQHAQLYAFAGVSTPSSSSATATPAPASGTATPIPADSPHEADEPPISTKESPPDRTEMLRGKPEVVGRFMELIVPILVDVYAASVITTVRIKTLTGLLKAISYLEAEEIKRVLTSVPVASFSSSILSSKDHPTLVIGALQLVELLLSKIPEEYRPAFRREGVFHEVELLADRTLISSKKKSNNNDKEKDKDLSDASSAPDLPPPPIPVPPAVAAGIPGFKKLSSLSLDPEDAVTLRARVIRFRYLTGRESNDADNVFATLRRLVERISDSSASEKEVGNALKELATLFTSAHTSVSSFELLQSGVIDGLLQFATDKSRSISIARRQELLLDAFIVRKSKVLAGSQTPFAIFVKKLQESLTRMEAFDVVTVTQGMDDSKRSSSPSLLARQLRLRLVAAEGSDIPKNFNNIVVSIHAIATFQALHDYLRPRVSGLMFSGSRLSGMLAALAGVTSGGLSATKPPDQPEASTSAGPSATVERRRSQRLSAKSAAAASEAVPEPPAVEAGPSNPPPASLGSSAEPPTSAAGEDSFGDNAEFTADFTDDDVEAEVFDDEIDPDNVSAEKTVTLSVADDGSKVEAQTPEGTRVGTPSAVPGSSKGSASRGWPSGKGSYASALKAKQTDWHLEFSMDDHPLPLDLTIYGAIHQHELRKKKAGPGSALPPHLLWQGVYTIKFKKVPGPAGGSSETSEPVARSRSPTPSLSSLPEDAPHAKILRLLRVLHKLNVVEAERQYHPNRSLPESAFVNNKLSAKLTRQLEEPMIVASQCLPDWALDLPQHFPFLFPFATRYNFLQSTSFGYARLILKWQSQQNRFQDGSRRDDGVGFLGRLQRQKVRISRKHILESAMKVFELYGSSSSILEVEYFEEVGTGLGPTLEFYALVSREFARRDLKIWRDDDPLRTGTAYVFHSRGLFPAPISAEDIANDGDPKRTHIIRVIGQFVAKAMLDSRIIDMSFNKVFLKLALGEDVPLTIDSLKLVDEDLAKSLEKLRSLTSSTKPLDKLQKLLKEKVDVEDLALDFTIPGYDIELRPNGRNITVTEENVEEYITEIIEAIIGEGAKIQAKAFREGFSKVFPITDLQAFALDELVMLFGNGEEDWSIETLNEAIKADHGFNAESRTIRNLIEVMSGFETPTRRQYLQFLTGSPRLPIGGFRGLNPPLTVVRKPHEAPLKADDYLPSVMTCVNYLKLPEYSSKDVMLEKLQVAMKEGVGSFHLS
ncbi:hypothetical protein EDB92DRAFT_2051252 [Lactarius akahatsu]|uniref:HECT-type E3 ubiquitin transferase n=1 Tax=Lactarius akahatsu TaxID=416441 RepID=A0AAD4LTF9_9AGAM|nr:hypothetical protein EDB92DRAFT_2051252 [Lactarius akahatsu]